MDEKAESESLIYNIMDNQDKKIVYKSSPEYGKHFF